MSARSALALRLRDFHSRIRSDLDRLIPAEMLADPENERRARLMTRFGFLGALFGSAYALFYLAIGHTWGAVIILLCTLGVMVSPFLMLWKNSVGPAANFFSFILTLGFLGLSGIEGGVHGHAIAWLVSVPLCALLLSGIGPALKWLIISFLAAGLLVGLDLAGVQLPVTYDLRWSALVSAGGYLGLILFMCVLGVLFERGRAQAYARMREALAQVAASNEQLTRLGQEKDEFLGIAAHDLRNPLTVILGNADLLRATAEGPGTRDLATMIVTASERMHQLIVNLLDVNAIEQGRFASTLERQDMGALLAACVDDSRPSATRKRIELRLGLSPDVFVRADGMAARQVLDNLISNAIKYSPFDSTVQVHLLCEREQALIRVRDEGPGISEEDQKRLFQKFSRLSARPTGGESSTGLGLSIAKKLAEAMAGTIECHSVLGCGASFTLRLPLDGASDSPATPPVVVSPPQRAAPASPLPEGVPVFAYTPPSE